MYINLLLLLKKYKGSLCRPNDINDLSKKITSKLEENKKVDYSRDLKNFRWEVLSKKLNGVIKNII